MKPLNLVAYLSLFLVLCACDSGADVSPESGKEYEVVVVMNNIAWDGKSGSLIREQLSTPVPFLQQSESSMNVTYVIPELFDDSTKYARNILIVNIDKIEYPIVSFQKKTDKWFDGQFILYINAPDEQSLETFLTDNRTSLLEYFTNEEMSRAKRRLAENHSDMVFDMVKKHFNITLHAPEDIVSFKDTTDCLWFSNNAAVGRTDLLVFSFSFENRESLSFENLVNKRDSIAKMMVPGVMPDTYMATNRSNIHYSTTTLHGKYCVIMRGLWHVQGYDSIAGPFVCYAHIDESSRRVIVTEGFVYEPVNEKRNYIKSLEASLQTVRYEEELRTKN
ncbi:MAG: DUF4837 family protein [Tannerella sp.]|jgi:hypothetical protein|nr:DUF4837 family protein [Tannerella sp.]